MPPKFTALYLNDEGRLVGVLPCGRFVVGPQSLLGADVVADDFPILGCYMIEGE